MTAAPADEGSTTPVVLGLACVVAVLGLLLIALGSVAAARHRAAAAADLAALAAAGAVLEGPTAACGLAAVVARDQGARLVDCALDGPTVDVAVEVRPPGRLGALGAARVRARAGPAGPLVGVQVKGERSTADARQTTGHVRHTGVT